LKDCCNVKERKDRKGKCDYGTNKLNRYEIKWRKEGKKRGKQIKIRNKYTLSPVMFDG
jgi:hypothetical protein